MPGDYTKRYSNEQEKRLAKSIQGEVQIASGSLPIASKKGDVRKKESVNWKLLIDGKTTMAKTHQTGVLSKEVKKEWLLKIKKEAFEGGYDIGALAISFDNKKDYYILDEVDFRNMYQGLLDYEEIVELQRQEIEELKSQLKEKDTLIEQFYKTVDNIVVRVHRSIERMTNIVGVKFSPYVKIVGCKVVSDMYGEFIEIETNIKKEEL